jgi:hypothetical protein
VRITGRILFADDAMPFSGGSARVDLDDTTYADAPARTLGHWRRDRISYPADAAGIPFEIVVDPDPPDGRRYSLRVLVDADADGLLGPGDYINVEAFPVPPGGGAVDVRVKRYAG